MDDLEDGELSVSDDEVYNPIARPVAKLAAPLPLSDYSDDKSSCDSDSSSDQPKKKRMCVSSYAGQVSSEPNGVKKRNNVWANIIQEEDLMQTISDIGVKKVRKTDRSVESYAIPRQIEDYSESDSDNESTKRIQRAKRFHIMEAYAPKSDAEKLMEERQLENIGNNEDLTAQQLGIIIARALKEQKADLIIKIVEVLGNDLTLQLYRKTQLVENNGGVMVMNGSRRRTSGGVFLYLLKTFENVTKENLSVIFLEEKEKSIQFAKKRKRKMKRFKSKNNVFSLRDIAEEEVEEANCKDFPEETAGIKCPGSTPVPSPQCSDPEEISRFSTDPVHLVEACEKAAMEIEGRM